VDYPQEKGTKTPQFSFLATLKKKKYHLRGLPLRGGI